MFSTRGRVRDKIQTAFQYLLIPIDGFASAGPGRPTEDRLTILNWGGCGLLAPVIRRHIILSNVRIWLYNSTRNATCPAGPFPVHGPLLKFDCASPVPKVPISPGCVFLGMAYYDWALSDVLWLVVNGLADATLLGTGKDAVYYGERVGKVVAATAVVYAAFVGYCMESWRADV